MGSVAKTHSLKLVRQLAWPLLLALIGGALVPEVRQIFGLDDPEPIQQAPKDEAPSEGAAVEFETRDVQPERQKPSDPEDHGDETSVAQEPQPARQSVPAQRSPTKISSHTLASGSPLLLQDIGTTVSVEFFTDLGGYATLRIHPAGGESIVESVLGPGGDIQFQTRSGTYRLSVTNWNKEASTLDIMIHPSG